MKPPPYIPRLLRDERGASKFEYLILLGLIALVSMAGFQLLRGRLLGKVDGQAERVRRLEAAASGEPGSAGAPDEELPQFGATASPDGPASPAGDGAGVVDALQGAFAAVAKPLPSADGASLCFGGTCVGGLCFEAGTPVLTAEGTVAIEELAVGDEVLSRDPESGRVSLKRVARTFVTHEREILDIELADDDGAVERIGITPEHRVWQASRGWREAGDLRPGDRAVGADGRELVVMTVAPRIEPATAYNLEVEDFHTYYVGELGAWVHNDCVGVTTDWRATAIEAFEKKSKAAQEKLQAAILALEPGAWEAANDYARQDLPARDPDWRRKFDAKSNATDFVHAVERIARDKPGVLQPALDALVKAAKGGDTSALDRLSDLLASDGRPNGWLMYAEGKKVTGTALDGITSSNPSLFGPKQYKALAKAAEGYDNKDAALKGLGDLAALGDRQAMDVLASIAKKGFGDEKAADQLLRAGDRLTAKDWEAIAVSQVDRGSLDGNGFTKALRAGDPGALRAVEALLTATPEPSDDRGFYADNRRRGAARAIERLAQPYSSEGKTSVTDEQFGSLLQTLRRARGISHDRSTQGALGEAIGAIEKKRAQAFEAQGREVQRAAEQFVQRRQWDMRQRFDQLAGKIRGAGEIGEISQETADKLRKDILDLASEMVLDNRSGAVLVDGKLITGDALATELVAMAQRRDRELGKSYRSPSMEATVRQLVSLNEMLVTEPQTLAGMVMSKDERIEIELAIISANREKFQKIMYDEYDRLWGVKTKLTEAWGEEAGSILGTITDAFKGTIGVSGKSNADSSWYAPGKIWSHTLGMDSDKEFLAVLKQLRTLDKPFDVLHEHALKTRWHPFWEQAAAVVKRLQEVGKDVAAYKESQANGKDFLTSVAATAVAAALAIPTGGQSMWLAAGVALGSGAVTKAGLNAADDYVAGKEVTAGGVTRNALFGGLDGISVFAGGQLSTAARNAIGKRVGLQLVEKGLRTEVSLAGANLWQRLAVHGVTSTTRGGTFGGIVGGGRQTVVSFEEIAAGRQKLSFQTLGDIGLATLHGTALGATLDVGLSSAGHGLAKLVRKKGAPLTEVELWKVLGGEGEISVQGANAALAKQFPKGLRSPGAISVEQATALEAYAELVRMKQWTRDILEVHVHKPQVPAGGAPVSAQGPPVGTIDDLIAARGLDVGQGQLLRGFLDDLERVTKQINGAPVDAAGEIGRLVETWRGRGIKVEVTEPIRIGGAELDRIVQQAEKYAAEIGDKSLVPEIIEQLTREKFEGILTTHVGKTYFVDPATNVVHVPGGIVVERAGVRAPLNPLAPKTGSIEGLIAELHARGLAEELAHGAGFGLRPGSYTPLSPRVAQFEGWLKTGEAREWLQKRGFSADDIAEMPAKIHEADAMELFIKNSRYSETEIGRYPVRKAYEAYLKEQPAGAAGAPLSGGGAAATGPQGAVNPAARARWLHDEIAAGRLPRGTSQAELLEVQAVALDRVQKLFTNQFGDDGALLEAVAGKRGAYTDALGRADKTVGQSRPVAQQQRDALKILLRTFQGSDAGDVGLRKAALEKLGKIGSRGDVDSLLALVRKPPTSTDLYHGLEAIKTIIARRGSPQARGTAALPADVRGLLSRPKLTPAEEARVIEQVLEHGEIASVKKHNGANMNEVYFVTFKETIPGPDGARIPIRGVFKPENTYQGKDKAFFSREVSAYEFDRDFARTGRVPVTVEAVLSPDQSPGLVKPFGTGSMQYMIPGAEALGETAVAIKPKFQRYLETAEGQQQLSEIRSLLYVLNDPDKLPNAGGFKTPNWGNIMAVADPKKPGSYRLFMIDNGGGQGALGKQLTGDMLPKELPARVTGNVGKVSQDEIRGRLAPLIGDDAAADVAGRAGKLGAPKHKPRAGAIDDGASKPEAVLPNGKRVGPDHHGGGYHGTDIGPEVVIEGRGLPGRGDNWNLAQHAENQQPAGKASAFRGTTHQPADGTGNGQGAADWAGEGNWVYEVDGVPTWNVNRHLENAIDVGNGLKRSNVMRGENENAIPAEIPRERIRRYGKVEQNSRGINYVREWIDNPHYIPPGPQGAQLMKALESVPAMVEHHAANGGSTFGMAQGEQLAGKAYWAVSPYKRLERVLPATTTGEQLAAEVRQYILDNKKILGEPGHSVGIWKNPETGEHYLDVVITTTNHADAQLIGAANQQEAIFDLSAGKMEPLPSGTLYKSRALDGAKVAPDGVRRQP